MRSLLIEGVNEPRFDSWTGWGGASDGVLMVSIKASGDGEGKKGGRISFYGWVLVLCRSVRAR